MAGTFQPLTADDTQPAALLLPIRANIPDLNTQGLTLAHQERVNIAVFIDFDNIEIGVRTTLNEHFDVGIILEALKERGEVVTKIAYADWTRAGEYSRHLTQHAIRLVQRNLTPGGDKNGADINLALDALEMAFTHPHINAYVIVGGDSDFLSLVEKLKQYDKKVFVIGGRAFTSVILQKNCHEFIAYENLVRKPLPARAGRPPAPSMASAPIAQAFPIVRRALKILADREVSPQTGLLKSTLLQLDSTFSERTYGASSFLDFAEKLAQAGLVTLKHAGRSVMVELNPGFSEDGDSATRSVRAAGDATSPDAALDAEADSAPVTRPPIESSPGPGGSAYEAPSRLGDNADGVRAAAQLMTGATNARWPMYLRNVKQILRAGGFDERRYGFGGLLDLMKACQREGLVRIERDRRGGLRVFQGPAFARTAAMPAIDPATLPRDVELDAESDGDVSADVDAEIIRVAEVSAESEAIDTEPIDVPPVTVVDTTAELLGRVSARRPRARTPRAVFGEQTTASAAPRAARSTGARKTGTRKPAAPKRARGRKTDDVSE
jgi:uncharacterized protein (TIGR00288 family)